MTNNVIPMRYADLLPENDMTVDLLESEIERPVLMASIREPESIEAQAALMAERLMDTSAILEVANEMLDEVLSKAKGRIERRGAANFVTIPNAELDINSPVTVPLMVALRDSPMMRDRSFSGRLAERREAAK